MNPVTRRAFLTSTAAAAAQAPRPNILFIVADSWRRQSAPGPEDPNLNAPALARLAATGRVCNRAYTSYAVCCPSRAAMLTGRLPHAAGVTRNHSQLPLTQQPMSAALKAAGYRTGYIGKFHLDGGDSPGFVPPQRRRGFDFWAAYNLAHKHYDGVYFRDSPQPIQTKGFEADYQTRLAIDFVLQPSTRPFFLYLSYVPPHAPLELPPGSPRYNPDRMTLRANVPDSVAGRAADHAAGYYGLCAALDLRIGRLLDALDTDNIAANTIVVFTADHGEMLESHGLDGFDVPYEESTGIPFLIRHPGRIQPGESNAPISNIDFAPTLLSMCGVPVPSAMQGRDLTAHLQTGRDPDPAPVYAEGSIGYKEEWRMVVDGTEKLVVDAAVRPTHFFDLAADPYERKNLVALPDARPRIERLTAVLRGIAVRTGDTLGATAAQPAAR